MTNSTLTKNQKKTFTKFYTEDGQRYKITATVRHDDECGNGYNNFAITGDLYEMTKNGCQVNVAGGCIHEEIKKHFPELAKYIKWHLCGTDGPTHYIDNTLYFAGDRDCWGKALGEPKGYEKAIKFEVVEIPTGYSEGKQREFEAARASAIWEDATDEELSLPSEELKQKLLDRLPKLLDDFKKDVEELGFIF